MRVRQIVQVATVGLKISEYFTDIEGKSCRLDLVKFSFRLCKKKITEKKWIPNLLSRPINGLGLKNFSHKWCITQFPKCIRRRCWVLSTVEKSDHLCKRLWDGILKELDIKLWMHIEGGSIHRVEARTGSLEGYRNIIWSFRDKIRQAKAHLCVARDVKDEKTFYKCIAGKRKNKKTVNPLLKKRRDLLDRTWLNTSFVLGFTNNGTLQDLQVPKARCKGWSEEIALWKRIRSQNA